MAEGNFSQALSAGFSLYQDDGGYSRTSQRHISGNNPDLPITYIYKESSGNWDQDTYAIDLAWILGYRLIDNILVYGGPYFIYGDLRGEQSYQLRTADNSQFNNGTIEEGTISLDSSGGWLALI